MFKKDTIWHGLLPGLILPLVVGFGYYMYMFGWRAFSVLSIITMEKTMPSLVHSLGCVLNLGIFFLFMRFNRLLSSRGVILSTFLYAGLILYLKVFA